MKKMANILIVVVAISGVVVLGRILYVAATGQYQSSFMSSGDSVGWNAVDNQYNPADTRSLPMPVSVSYDRATGTATLYVEPGASADEKEKIKNYFLTLMRISLKDMWVSLLRYDPRVTSPALSTTLLGADLLASDYLMKFVVARYKTSPEFGMAANEYFMKAYGTSDVPLDFSGKTKAVNGDIVLSATDTVARIDAAPLKCVSRADMVYLSGDAYADDYDFLAQKFVAPAVEKVVNENYSFSCLRQIYRCFILAQWVKTNFPVQADGKVENMSPAVFGEIKDKHTLYFGSNVFALTRDTVTVDGRKRTRTHTGGGVMFRSFTPTITRVDKDPIPENADTIVFSVSEMPTPDAGVHMVNRYADGNGGGGATFSVVAPDDKGGVEL